MSRLIRSQVLNRESRYRGVLPSIRRNCIKEAGGASLCCAGVLVMNHCRLVFAACFILVSSLASADGQPSAGNQDGASQEKSLADVAKEAKQKKAARAKNT